MSATLCGWSQVSHTRPFQEPPICSPGVRLVMTLLRLSRRTLRLWGGNTYSLICEKKEHVMPGFEIETSVIGGSSIRWTTGVLRCHADSSTRSPISRAFTQKFHQDLSCASESKVLRGTAAFGYFHGATILSTILLNFQIGPPLYFLVFPCVPRQQDSRLHGKMPCENFSVQLFKFSVASRFFLQKIALAGEVRITLVTLPLAFFPLPRGGFAVSGNHPTRFSPGAHHTFWYRRLDNT